MNKLVIESAVGWTCALVVLGACASENLQTTGLEPGQYQEEVVPAQPGAAPSQTAAPETQAASPNPAPSAPSGSTPEAAMPVGLAPAPAQPPASGAAPTTPMTNPGMQPPAATQPPPVATLTPAEVGGQLEGFLHLSPCQSQDFGHDCTLPLCQGTTKTVTQTLQLGGDPDTIYDLTIHVYGVVEPRSYQGGTRRAGANFDVNGRDFWYVGGVVPANPGTYNTYEMHVNPPITGAANTYFLNSRTGGDTPALIRLDYDATFPVQGRGTITWRSFDSNCRQITNCDDTECGTIGPKPVTLTSVVNADPPPPATFTQPYSTGANIGRGQWIYIDVTNVVARQ